MEPLKHFKLAALPENLQWRNSPSDWRVESGTRLTIMAGQETDWFIDPAGNDPKDNAPSALFEPADENFILSAKVSVDFAAAFDAGVLQVRVRDDLWAKLCFEFSPQGQPMIVSVVTRGVSDDCNSLPIAGHEIYLRMARNAPTFAFHYSQDGAYWHLIRYFALGLGEPGRAERLWVGFSAQSPTGEQCRAVFSEIGYRPGRLEDIRSGE